MKLEYIFEKKKIMIWGAGLYGDVAYHFYSDSCNIVGYIDADERKWGNVKNGVIIFPPKELLTFDGIVVVAIKRGGEAVCNVIQSEYKKGCILFGVKEESYTTKSEEKKVKISDDTIIVSFSGGLGNQMFQYALARNYMKQGKKVFADIEMCRQGRAREYSLSTVFHNIHMELCSQEEKRLLINQKSIELENEERFILYREAGLYETDRQYAEMFLLNITGGIVRGYHQNYVFPSKVREELLVDFQFPLQREKKLKQLETDILSSQSVGIHIRRGDYLTNNNRWIYGDVCSDKYYHDAFTYIKERRKDLKFYFFSDDIQWVKKNYEMEHAVYVDISDFENYQDWYDMYLMSLCKDNIIANSTFSWWGAWLNTNSDKIICAPQKWINNCDYVDICPPEWVRL